MPDTVDADAIDGTTDGLLDVVEPEPDVDVAAEVARLAKFVETQAAEIRSLKSGLGRPRALPRAQSPRERISQLTAGSSLNGQYRHDPTGLKPKFRTDDVVKLIDKDKLAALRTAKKVTGDEPCLGVVLDLMYRRKKDNMAKYRVDFPDYGDDGIMECDLEMYDQS